ncbi:LpqB family beta-propeller domain-containing protein [Geodermatophilus sp. YIM 151500]|uniref:LpqB family beta-propeller domain-containing protein n=1 Tax=Geodermatophilus sp. YIM 151500 TaxID=2984531 RepID=UPI0021E4FAE8|nr:LpqB family beta-propeller domain-containing protein [Geodermatophilus sp. YIM 151500]MCV2488610.1 LpqB family beta-propeller domain-containing protein [Geodermatophilus sp. YIM 151500]
MTRRPGRRPALALLAVLLGTTGCSTVPTDSPTVQITQAPSRPEAEVGIEPLSPEPGASPEDVVAGFVDAAASTVRGHPIAREHLAPEAAATWSDDAGITVLGPDYATVTTALGRVRMTATVVGTVDERGVFDVGVEPLTRDFSLVEVEGEWRITDPPEGLLMLEQDFQRLYDERAVYFVDPTGQRVVPDPRYLIAGDAQPNALVQRLLDGPSPALAPGVRNALAGASLRRSVTVEGQTAVVDLTELPTDPAPLLSEVSAQIVWTLGGARIRQVLLTVDGERMRIDGVPAQQTVDDWASFDPDAVPVDGVGHYVDGGVLRTVTRGEPAPGPAGEGAYPLSSAAVSADARTDALSFLVGVVPREGGGQSLLAGPYGGTLASVLDGGSLTVPTVAGTREEAWAVRDGREVVRVPAGANPQPVTATTLEGLGRATALQLSPDGVRAAVVVDGGQGRRLYVGTVVRGEDGGVALRDLRQVAPSLNQVVDVAWQDSGSLLVLAGDASEERIVPYAVGVDGWGLTDVATSGLPSQPESIAAAPTRQPLVSAGGAIWQRSGGSWATLRPGAEPVPGAQPFFPL